MTLNGGYFEVDITDPQTFTTYAPTDGAESIVSFSDGNDSQDITIKVFNPCFTSTFDLSTIPINDNLDSEYFIFKFDPAPLQLIMGEYQQYQDTASQTNGNGVDFCGER